jgi:FHA domain
LRTLVIGRSPFADIVVADASLAPHHAELVVIDDGRLYLTDCATEGGTWRQAAAPDSGAGAWQPVRQAFVRADEPLRLGDYPCTAAELMRAARGGGHGEMAGMAPGGPGDGWRVRGRVERDPATGEIVRRRP